MRRRGFLAGLLALPFVAPLARAAQAVKRRLFPVVYVGKDQPITTVAEAMKHVEPGGTIYLLPGHCETFVGTLDCSEVGMIIGLHGKGDL